VHDTVRVRVVQSFAQLIEVQPHFGIGEPLQKHLAFNMRDVLIDKTGGVTGLVSDDIVELDYVRATEESLENLDFSVDFFDPDWLEDLDDTFLIVLQIHTLINLRILPPSELMHHLVVVLGPPGNLQFLVVRVILRSLDAHVLVEGIPGTLRSGLHLIGIYYINELNLKEEI